MASLSSLSEPTSDADSEEEAWKGLGRGGPIPSASTAACADDEMNKDKSVLHVQVNLAQQGVSHLRLDLEIGRGTQASDNSILPVQLCVSDRTPAFRDSFYVLLT